MRLLVSTSVLVLMACQSGPPPTLRTLPTTLSTDAARLLAGCQMQDGAFELQVTCPDDVVVARQSQPPALEATFLAVADDEAHARAARVLWTALTLTTDAGPLPLRQAVYLGDDRSDLGFLSGVSRARGQLRDDFWCSAPSTTQLARCEAILTALLQDPATPPAVSEPAPTPAPPPADDAPTAQVAAGTGGAQMMGRALTLPTTCRVARQEPRAGVYQCEGHSLSWKVIDDMDRAADEADALFSALPTDEEPQPLSCRLGYETAVCRGTGNVVVGTAFIDGVAVFAQCVARDADVDVRQAGPCRALLQGAW
jgi:hypothetical protein